jgi:hypothetical protein
MDREITILKYGFKSSYNKPENRSSTVSLDEYVKNLKTFTKQTPTKTLNVIDNKTKTDPVIATKTLNVIDNKTKTDPVIATKTLNVIDNKTAIDPVIPTKTLNVIDNKTAIDPVIPTKTLNVKTINTTDQEPTKKLNIPEIREKLFASVDTLNVSTKNSVIENTLAPEDGFALEQNILELFITEIDEKILIPE